MGSTPQEEASRQPTQVEYELTGDTFDDLSTALEGAERPADTLERAADRLCVVVLGEEVVGLLA